jgi:ABC-type antimicrobial peptide transport system permease subunit
MLINNMLKQTRKMERFLGIIGAVSLVVAAIGIANTMIMSVYERTKEIGIMKMIGAKNKDIKRLFLLEAALIGFLGGLVGALISMLLSYLLNNIDLSFINQNNYYGSGSQEKELTSYIPVWLYMSSIIFSGVIGLISGYLPAARAAKLSVIDAMRNE